MTEKQQEEDFDAMFNNNDDVFDGLDDVDTWDRLPWFEPNYQYDLQVDSIKFVHSNKNTDRFYVLSFTILKSDCEALPEGTRAAHIIKCSSDKVTRAYGPMNFKQFLSGITGIPSTKKDVSWGSMAKAAISEGIFNGQKVKLQTRLNKDGTFTNHTYSQFIE